MTDTTVNRWHVGANVPGYSPEQDITCCESADEARDALLEELRRTRDAFDGCDHENITDGCESCARYQAIRDLCTSIDDSEMDVSEGYSAMVDIGRSLPIHHWVERTPDGPVHAECNPDS